MAAGALTPDVRDGMLGVFAAGDARYGSVKRLASAMGRGIAVQSVPEYLERFSEEERNPLWKIASTRRRDRKMPAPALFPAQVTGLPAKRRM
jgi:hypothetical protein